MPSKLNMANWVEKLQSQGRYTFTRFDAESETGRSFIAVQSALRRLKEQNRVVSPRRGFYVIVPPEYRSAGSIPASWFINDLMQFIAQPYYVGLLSAAAIYGAAHQQPMVFQVITDKPTRPIHIWNNKIEFFMCKQINEMPVKHIQTETGTIPVSTPETTAFDLVRYQDAAGHLNNVATVLTELAEQLDVKSLLRLTETFRVPDVQRLGYILDEIGEEQLADSLAKWLESKSFRVVKLSTGEQRVGRISNRWKVVVSEPLESDL